MEILYVALVTLLLFCLVMANTTSKSGSRGDFYDFYSIEKEKDREAAAYTTRRLDQQIADGERYRKWRKEAPGFLEGLQISRNGKSYDIAEDLSTYILKKDTEYYTPRYFGGNRYGVYHSYGLLKLINIGGGTSTPLRPASNREYKILFESPQKDLPDTDPRSPMYMLRKWLERGQAP